MDDPRPIRIISSRPARVDHDAIVFIAEDAAGELQVYVTLTHWETLKAEAPPMSDSDDRHDFALSRIEAEAVGRDVGVRGDGVRVVLVG